MKKFTLALLLCLTAGAAFAKDGYRIQVKFLGERDSVVYLAHYFGKSLPTIYKMDSARVDKKGVALFEKKEKVLGGIYIILPSARKSYFEFLLNNGDNLEMTADMSKLPESLEIKGSKENEDFIAYQSFLKGYGKKQEQYKADLAKATTKADTMAIQEKSLADFKSVETYRKRYTQSNPDNILGRIFNAMERREAPKGPHYLPNGKVDSAYAWKYYRKHFWDGFAFNDDRLIHAPILDSKLDEYFNKVVPQREDTVIWEADTILAKMRGGENLFKYTLNWLSTNAQTSKVMGMDKVFVHLVENYYQKGDANWMGEEELQKYFDRAAKIAPNVVGKPAPRLRMLDMNMKERPLLSVPAKYTLLVFWEPTCGHCMKEMPLLDSVYRASLKDRGVQVYAVMSNAGEEKERKEYLKKHKLDEFIHVWDPKRNTGYYSLYDVNSTPSIYLIDEQKHIIGKKLDHTSVGKVIDMVERRKSAQ